MTDHKAEANRKVISASAGQSAPQHRALTSEAMVHATLYLAEQQRIANLIAFIAEWNLGQQREDEGAGRGRDAVIKASSQIMDGLAL